MVLVWHKAGSEVTDGVWKNDGKWAAARVYLNEGIDLSTYENLVITFTNSSASAYVEFGIGNNPSGDEYDYVKVQSSQFINDGNPNIVTLGLDNYSSATSVTCTWGGTHEKSLDMSNIKGFSISSSAIINVSKIVATKHEDEGSKSKELALIKDGKTYSSTVDVVKSTLESGVWTTDASYNHSRILFKDKLDLTNYETIEITYKATCPNTWATSGEFGIGNNPTSTDYHFVPITKNINTSGNESVVVLNVKDYLNTNITCTWGNTEHTGVIDVTKIAGISVKAGTITMTITSVVAKSSLLTFVEKISSFNLCDASSEEISSIIEEYNLLLTKNDSAGYYKLDESTTLAERMNYMEMVLNKKVTNANRFIESNLITRDSDDSKVSLIALFAIAGIIAISGYYFIEKRKIYRK